MRAPVVIATGTPWAEQPTLIERGLKWLTLGGIVFLIVYPFLFVFGTSIASVRDIVAGGGVVLFPREPTLANYAALLESGVVTRAFLVSTAVTVIGTFLSMATTTTLAYALSRPIIGRRRIVVLILFTLLFHAGIIPNYLLVKQLGLLNTYAALILPVLINTFNLIVMRQFFMSIPEELVESARIDGAGDLSILWRIVLPLSTAVMAVIALFYAVAYWNAFFHALLYINDTTMWPLPLVVRQYVLQDRGISAAEVVPGAELAPEAIRMAIVVLAVLPILVIYPFLQRYFTRAVLSGAIKG